MNEISDIGDISDINNSDNQTEADVINSINKSNETNGFKNSFPIDKTGRLNKPNKTGKAAAAGAGRINDGRNKKVRRRRNKNFEYRANSFSFVSVDCNMRSDAQSFFGERAAHFRVGFKSGGQIRRFAEYTKCSRQSE